MQAISIQPSQFSSLQTLPDPVWSEGYLVVVGSILYLSNGHQWIPLVGDHTFSNGFQQVDNLVSVLGTPDRITVYPDRIDIADNWVGQTSISTVGTVVAGTWEATPISVQYGGLPLPSSVPDNMVLVGNGTSVIQTSKTVPAGGFVGTTDVQTLSNKTLSSPVIVGNATLLAGTQVGSNTNRWNIAYANLLRAQHIALGDAALDSTTIGIQFSQPSSKMLVLYDGGSSSEWTGYGLDDNGGLGFQSPSGTSHLYYTPSQQLIWNINSNAIGYTVPLVFTNGPGYSDPRPGFATGTHQPGPGEILAEGQTNFGSGFLRAKVGSTSSASAIDLISYDTTAFPGMIDFYVQGQLVGNIDATGNFTVTGDAYVSNIQVNSIAVDPILNITFTNTALKTAYPSPNPSVGGMARIPLAYWSTYTQSSPNFSLPLLSSGTITSSGYTSERRNNTVFFSLSPVVASNLQFSTSKWSIYYTMSNKSGNLPTQYCPQTTQYNMAWLVTSNQDGSTPHAPTMMVISISPYGTIDIYPLPTWEGTFYGVAYDGGVSDPIGSEANAMAMQRAFNPDWTTIGGFTLQPVELQWEANQKVDLSVYS
jgi:hypothetical protein